jgi:hypothetical protein
MTATLTALASILIGVVASSSRRVTRAHVRCRPEGTLTSGTTRTRLVREPATERRELG